MPPPLQPPGNSVEDSQETRGGGEYSKPRCKGNESEDRNWEWGGGRVWSGGNREMGEGEGRDKGEEEGRDDKEGRAEISQCAEALASYGCLVVLDIIR